MEGKRRRGVSHRAASPDFPEGAERQQEHLAHTSKQSHRSPPSSLECRRQRAFFHHPAYLEQAARSPPDREESPSTPWANGAITRLIRLREGGNAGEGGTEASRWHGDRVPR